MKVLLVHPGATWSVADVWRGLFDAFEEAGAEVVLSEGSVRDGLGHSTNGLGFADDIGLITKAPCL